jgi:iron complex transport system substrate-binding protein
MGALMDEPDKAEEIIEYYRSSYEEIKARRSATSFAPSVMFLYYNTKGGTASFMSPGADWLQTTMTMTAGGNPLSLGLEGTGWNNVNMEQIAEWNPEIIFIVTYTDDPSCQDVKNLIKADELWQGIEAVHNNRLYSVPDDCFGTATVGSWDTSGSRWILCLRWMEAKISSDDTGLLEHVKGFYVDLYGLSVEEAEELMDSIVGDI